MDKNLNQLSGWFCGIKEAIEWFFATTKLIANKPKEETSMVIVPEDIENGTIYCYEFVWGNTPIYFESETRIVRSGGRFEYEGVTFHNTPICEWIKDNDDEDDNVKEGNEYGQE